MQVWKNWWQNSLLEGWPTCSQEVVEVHHHVHSRVQERSKATLPSSNKPDIVQINEINGRSHLICYLGPHQQRRGRVPWWITWRGDRWVNFFRATKNIESARSINWKNNKRIELEKKVWDYLSFELDKLMCGWEWFAGSLFDFYWDLDLDMSLMILYLWEVVPPCEVEGPLGQGTCAIIHRLADPVVLSCHVETPSLEVNVQ